MRNYFAIFRKIIIFASWYSAICWICSHTLRGCVDWNESVNSKICQCGRHTLRGCVDWNLNDAEEPSIGRVTPFVGVWIETIMKWIHKIWPTVTPFVGVWIETISRTNKLTPTSVTPFVGVWIETSVPGGRRHPSRSHPSWVCGLKHHREGEWFEEKSVTPFVGVWIETSKKGDSLP